jgi:methionyl-tRNA formyltransferase
VWEAKPAGASNLSPGELKVEGERLFVGCGKNTALELIAVQPEGKKRMSARDFVNGHQPKAKETL